MRKVLLLATLFAMACGGPAAPTAADVTGEWLKEDQSLPPVSLMLTRDSSAGLRARLRLSGVEAFGNATLSGDQISIAFDGRPPLTGAFISSTELDLSFGASNTYRLRKQ
jgi:hypothetical protein